MIPVDLSALPASVVDELIKGRHARDAMTLLKAPETQMRLAQDANVQHRSIDGLGQPTLNIAAEAYHYWGQRLGYECWRDKQFLREFKRDNPACRIKATGTRIQSGAAGAKEIGVRSLELGGKRFHKSYG